MSRSPFHRSTRQSLTSSASTWHDRTAEGGFEKHREKDRILDEAYDEYCRLLEAGQSIQASVFCERYPTYRRSLRRLIDVHHNLEQIADLDKEPWPVPGQLFLGFDIIGELGMGAIARVYLAAERALGGRGVAVKVSPFGDEEAETLGKLSHTNVVPVHSVQFDPDTKLTAVCMPYLGSATLADVLDEAFAGGRPPEYAKAILATARDHERFLGFVDRAYARLDVHAVFGRGSYVDGVVQLVIEMADALDYTHSQGILHRDLKPSNVLLTPSAQPMLLDFNLSCNIHLDVGRVGGTLPYMPPEQIRDVHEQAESPSGGADPRSDIFALGVILYELLTGRLPFGEPPEDSSPREAAEWYLEAQQRPPTPVNRWNRQVDRTLTELVHACLELDPAARPASARELGERLRRRFARPARLRRWAALHRWRLSSGMAAAALATSLSIGYVASLPPYPVRQLRMGMAELVAGDCARALPHLERAVEAAPDLAAARFARGVALQRMGEHLRALADLQLAAETARVPVIYEVLGDSLLEQKKAREALLAYASAGRTDKRPELRIKQAYAMTRAGLLGSAESELDRVLVDHPLLQPAYHLRSRVRLGLVKSGFGTIDGVLSDVTAALHHGPPNTLLEFDAARAYALAAQQQPSLEQQALTLIRSVAQAWPASVLQADELLGPLVDDAGLSDTAPSSAADINPADAAAELFATKADLNRVAAALDPQHD